MGRQNRTSGFSVLRAARIGVLVAIVVAAIAAPLGAQACPLCDLGELARWFEGEFGGPADSVRTIHAPIRLRELGPRVFYVEEHRAEPEPSVRQWIYSFEVTEDGRDPNEAAAAEGVEGGDAATRGRSCDGVATGEMAVPEVVIVQRIFALADAAAYLGAHTDRKRFRGLTVDQLDELEGCEVGWSRVGDVFVGRPGSEACRGGRSPAIPSRLSLDALWLSERGAGSADTPLALARTAG